ncbi:hypothetical protein HPC49_01810 [Pyxidicoccus fallax]|uniref:histidine kinase n=1 Tax=Pyxidicoccus fallax TaxID=394095 RepID=A0A848L8B6_9BACT|nr:hypothetical protein [Pyxidicoccus fallax]NPC76988.1 hypothetical protein [Pyxidicoccus fallax]
MDRVPVHGDDPRGEPREPAVQGDERRHERRGHQVVGGRGGAHHGEESDEQRAGLGHGATSCAPHRDTGLTGRSSSRAAPEAHAPAAPLLEGRLGWRVPKGGCTASSSAWRTARRHPSAALLAPSASADKVRQREDELRHANESLEQRVEERTRELKPFLITLGQHVVDERQEIISLLEDVCRYTEHVGDIVKLQQNHARTPRMHAPVQLAELVEDALRFNASGLSRHQVKGVRELAPLPPVLTDKHKALMILVNLNSNAQYALDGVPPDERLLTVRLAHTENHRIRIELRDNGMGIAPEMLTRIFQFGFTTREEGHGFCLHSSALAAQELGGSLTAHSEGLGRGATFSLELPSVPVQEAA